MCQRMADTHQGKTTFTNREKKTICINDLSIEICRMPPGREHSTDYTNSMGASQGHYSIDYFVNATKLGINELIPFSPGQILAPKWSGEKAEMNQYWTCYASCIAVQGMLSNKIGLLAYIQLTNAFICAVLSLLWVLLPATALCSFTFCSKDFFLLSRWSCIRKLLPFMPTQYSSCRQMEVYYCLTGRGLIFIVTLALGVL